MLSKDPNYRRLFRGRSAFGAASYWLAKDHLLIVEVRGVVESYRRIALKDIQSLSIHRTRWYWVGLGLCLPPLLIAGGILTTLTTATDMVVQVFLGIVAGILLIVLLVHLLNGHTAFAELQTAVQTVRLPGIRRWRVANRLMAQLVSEVDRAQAARFSPAPASAASAAPPPASDLPAPV